MVIGRSRGMGESEIKVLGFAEEMKKKRGAKRDTFARYEFAQSQK